MEYNEPSKKTSLSKSDIMVSETLQLNASFTLNDVSFAPLSSNADFSSTAHSTNDESSNENLAQKNQSEGNSAESKKSKISFSVDNILNIPYTPKETSKENYTKSKVSFSVDHILSTKSKKDVPDTKFSPNDQQNDLFKNYSLDVSNIVTPSNMPVALVEKSMLHENKITQVC